MFLLPFQYVPPSFSGIGAQGDTEPATKASIGTRLNAYTYTYSYGTSGAGQNKVDITCMCNVWHTYMCQLYVLTILNSSYYIIRA